MNSHLFIFFYLSVQMIQCHNYQGTLESFLLTTYEGLFQCIIHELYSLSYSYVALLFSAAYGFVFYNQQLEAARNCEHPWWLLHKGRRCRMEVSLL